MFDRGDETWPVAKRPLLCDSASLGYQEPVELTETEKRLLVARAKDEEGTESCCLKGTKKFWRWVARQCECT